jgi:hypothetical protein
VTRRDQVAQPPYEGRAPAAHDGVDVRDALMPVALSAELQPRGTQRVEVGILRGRYEPVDTGRALDLGKHAVGDQAAQVGTGDPESSHLPSGHHAPLLARNRTHCSECRTPGHGSIVAILKRPLPVEPRQTLRSRRAPLNGPACQISSVGSSSSREGFALRHVRTAEGSILEPPLRRAAPARLSVLMWGRSDVCSPPAVGVRSSLGGVTSTRVRGLKPVLERRGRHVVGWVMSRGIDRSYVVEHGRHDGVDVGFGTPDAVCAYFVGLPYSLHAADSRALTMREAPGARMCRARTKMPTCAARLTSFSWASGFALATDSLE